MAAATSHERISKHDAADGQVDDRRLRQELATALRGREPAGEGRAVDRAVNNRREDAQLVASVAARGATLLEARPEHCPRKEPNDEAGNEPADVS